MKMEERVESTASQMRAGLDRDTAIVVVLRRVVSIGVLALATVLTVLLAPLWLPAAALADLMLKGRRCTLRCGLFLAYYLACEWGGLTLAVGNVVQRTVLRDARSEKEMRRLTALQAMWSGWLLWGAARIFGFEVEVSGREALERGPMILMLRHASVADTVLAGVFVSGEHGVPLRYVLKHELLWDPCLDVVGNRLPNYFVRRESDDPDREVRSVVALLDGLGEREGLLIYPEGTRFTESKRLRILERLRKSGDAQILARAEALHHTLPPRLSGILALLERNPGLDVVVAAHVGFDGAGSFWDLWNGALYGTRVRVHFWRVPHAQLPTDRAAAISWLYDQWDEVDRWVGAHRPTAEAPR